jgi:hypothetical protein
VPFPEKGPAQLIRWSDRRRESRNPPEQSKESPPVDATADSPSGLDSPTEPVVSP